MSAGSGLSWTLVWALGFVTFPALACLSLVLLLVVFGEQRTVVYLGSLARRVHRWAEERRWAWTDGARYAALSTRRRPARGRGSDSSRPRASNRSARR